MSALEAGRELDALVAEKVMGYCWWRWVHLPERWPVSMSGRWLNPPIGPYGTEGADYVEADASVPLSPEAYDVVPQFSSDIAAAWQVVAELTRREIHVHLEIGDRACCELWKLDDLLAADGFALAMEETAQLAICRAALAAMEAL